MNSKIGVALTVIGIASVLMLVLAPITANQTFGYIRYGRHMAYGPHGFAYGKHMVYGHGHACVKKVYRGPHGVYKRVVCR
jgi:hypothetical protein